MSKNINTDKLDNKLFSLLKKQRDYYYRDICGDRVVTNRLLYDSLEDELLEVQLKISRENKKRITAEYKARGLIPCFRFNGTNESWRRNFFIKRIDGSLTKVVCACCEKDFLAPNDTLRWCSVVCAKECIKKYGGLFKLAYE